MSKKIYRLKPYDDVTNHHFINSATWNYLANCDLEVEFGRGIFSESAIVCPTDEKSLANTYVVSKDDLREVVYEAPNCNCDKVAPDPNATAKTYTLKDVREAGMRAMAKIEDEDEAVVSALAISKLIYELN